MTCVLQPFTFSSELMGNLDIFFSRWKGGLNGPKERNYWGWCGVFVSELDLIVRWILNKHNFFFGLFIWRILFCTQPAGLVNKACAHMISHSNSFVYVWEWGFPLKIWHFFSKVASQNHSFSPKMISAPGCPLQCLNLDTIRSQLFKPHQQSIWAAYFMKVTLNNYSVCNLS